LTFSLYFLKCESTSFACSLRHFADGFYQMIKTRGQKEEDKNYGHVRLFGLQVIIELIA
jgi:hypothetical protein